MNSLVLNRRKFIIWYEVLLLMSQVHKDDHMFIYHVSRNLGNMVDEYNSLKQLSEPTSSLTELLEFNEKKQELVEKMKLEGITEKFECEEQYKDLVVEYEVPVKKYDIDSNTIGSFMHEKTNFSYYPIPYRYIPKEVIPIGFEFIYGMIEEDINILINKYGK